MREIEVTVECKFCVTHRLKLTDAEFDVLKDDYHLPQLERIQQEMLQGGSVIENPEFDFCAGEVTPDGKYSPIVEWD